MSTVLLVIHVIAAVLFLGPVSVAISTFPKYITQTRNTMESPQGTSADVSLGAQSAGAATVTYKISSSYGILSMLVPMIGVAIMFTDMGYYWRDGRYHLSIVLALIAWLLLITYIIPKQKTMMGSLGLLPEFELDGQTFAVRDWDSTITKMRIFAQVFIVLWVIMAIVMFLPYNFGL